ncbi:MAG: hypothetical protein AAGB01_01915 [Cyanobacteria bacterium P01_F01_bin.42]
MKRLLTQGFIAIGAVLILSQAAAADWLETRCTYELTNQTSRRIYFFINTKRNSLGVGETLSLNACDSEPFPRMSLFQSHPFFARPTIIFDSKLGNGYVLKTIQLSPGANAFIQSGLRLSIQ